MGRCGMILKIFVEYYRSDDKSPEDRGKWMGRMMYQHYAERILQWELANAAFERHALLKDFAVSVTCDYITSWFDDTWPNLVEMVCSQITRHARRLQGGERI